MFDVNLARFATRDRAAFNRPLDGHTLRLMAKLPERGASWGLARKLLNIFLRDWGPSPSLSGPGLPSV
jgi:hypothetical protein|tara:strand:+ start:285 stop:488 length:204 start_codon:yes stop_codon:yes gene_type:complete